MDAVDFTQDGSFKMECDETKCRLATKCSRAS